jgi:hypothetical protein
MEGSQKSRLAQPHVQGFFLKFLHVQQLTVKLSLQLVCELQYLALTISVHSNHKLGVNELGCDQQAFPEAS